MLYRWRGLRFECPEGRDDSSILMVDPQVPPKWNLSVRVDELPAGPGGLVTYVGALTPAAGATQTGKSERKAGGRPATVLEYELKVRGGAMKQRQALVAEGQRVHIFTLTATAAGETFARAAFDKLLDSLAWE